MTSDHSAQATCQVCNKVFDHSDLFPAALIRPSIYEYIESIYPDWSEEGFICYEDLKKFRSAYVKTIVMKDRGELSELDKTVVDSLKEHELITENINTRFDRQLTIGEKLSDRVARFGGSWTFIISFIVVMVVWMTINILIFTHRFDPYPFILLNLVLSCLAALQAPVIMMSQNRQSEKDRMQADDNYCTNLKSELEIRQLHAKLDQFMKKQWERIMEVQQIQLDLAEELLESQYKKFLKKNPDPDQ